MAISNWFDTLTEVFEITVRNETVKSYKLKEFPETIKGVPSALSYPTAVSYTYGSGQGLIAIWEGVTELHLSTDINKSKNFPLISEYYAAIVTAAAGNVQLDSKVDYFLLRDAANGGPSIEGPVELVFGQENPHHGLLVYWRVKELSTITVT
jgi:hypothetical protein